ncbi:hypothetical protein [Gimesia aquarii]|uniref:Uncharacterized protein n=1 Tax=Gimesia aquarii TaxID=2527964 RepID=A0A517WSE0_9PLAN|nr:hypothetical protein [Gimesia aquarii]QDU08171.1 hypothetical protein V202x_15350 [Gimesia aquarii]
MTYLDTEIHKTASMLKRWQGHLATIYELNSSHSSLSVVIHGDSYGQNLVIACLGPEYICGPTTWEDSCIILKTIELESSREGIALLDERHNVKITAESFEIKENVKL